YKYYFFYEHTGSWRSLSRGGDITWGGHHVRNIKNLNHEKHPLPTMKTPLPTTKTPNGALLPIMWLLAASCCLSVRFQDPTDLFYMLRAECSGTGAVKGSVSRCSGSSA